MNIDYFRKYMTKDNFKRLQDWLAAFIAKHNREPHWVTLRKEFNRIQGLKK